MPWSVWGRIGLGIGLVLAAAGCGDGEVDDPATADEPVVRAPADHASEGDAGTQVEEEGVPADPGADAGEAEDPDADAAEAEDPGAEAGEVGEEDDPYAIPEDGIDEAYVERVLEAIYEVNREALAVTLEAEPGLVPAEAENRLRSIYGRSYAALQYQALAEVAGSQELRASMRDPVGPLRSELLAMTDDDPRCIVIKVRDDFSAVLQEPPVEEEGYLALAPKPDDRDPEELNPTPWVVADGALNSADDLSCD
jgi:hypothetical protein